MKPRLLALVAIGAAACSSNNGGPPNPDAGNDGGTPVMGHYYNLDSSTMQIVPIAMAVGPNDRVGMAYFKDVSSTDYEIRYVEWQNGTAGNSEKIQTVQRVYGISLAFQNNGQPAVAYLGGPNKSMSLYWLQSNATLSYRQPNGSWVEQVAVQFSGEAYCGNPVSDQGDVVGLHPALVFVGSSAYVLYRDVEYGQSTQTGDYTGSDLEVAIGGPTSWVHAPVVCGGNNKRGWGGHIQAIVVGGQPAAVSDWIPGAADDTGANVFFHRRYSDGSWRTMAMESPPVPVVSVYSTQHGPSLAYDSTLGYAIAILERTNNTLYFTSSSDDGNHWTTPDPVWQSGTGGWYPSIAVDPSTHEPNIAYYFCSTQAGVVEGSCPASQNELRVAVRVLGNWRQTRIDSQGGVLPKIAYLSTGKRVIAYRNPQSGALNLFVDQ